VQPCGFVCCQVVITLPVKVCYIWHVVDEIMERAVVAEKQWSEYFLVLVWCYMLPIAMIITYVGSLFPEIPYNDANP
jgi:hypothetical protein